MVDGMLVTVRARTVIDCLRVLPDGDAGEFLDRALQRQWIVLEELFARIRAHYGRHGMPRLLRLARQAAGGAWSEAERRLHRLLRSAGISGWRANHPIPGGTGRPIAIGDVVFVRAHLVVEVDGRAYHSDPDAFGRDRYRQNQLVAAGWTVLRFTWADLVERPDYVVESIRALLATRPG